MWPAIGGASRQSRVIPYCGLRSQKQIFQHEFRRAYYAKYVYKCYFMAAKQGPTCTRNSLTGYYKLFNQISLLNVHIVRSMDVWPFISKSLNAPKLLLQAPTMWPKSVPILMGKYFQLCVCGWLLPPPSSKIYKILRFSVTRRQLPEVCSL